MLMLSRCVEMDVGVDEVENGGLLAELQQGQVARL